MVMRKSSSAPCLASIGRNQMSVTKAVPNIVADMVFVIQFQSVVHTNISQIIQCGVPKPSPSLSIDSIDQAHCLATPTEIPTEEEIRLHIGFSAKDVVDRSSRKARIQKHIKNSLQVFGAIEAVP